MPSQIEGNSVTGILQLFIAQFYFFAEAN